MPHPLPTIDELRRLLTYDPDTGALHWLARTPDMFAGATEQARRRTCACWNGQYAGKPAMIGIDGYGYHQGPVKGRYLKAHRVAWALYYGKWPSKKCSHRNSDHRDNRIANLRDVDHRTCHLNAKLSKRNTSGAAGVVWNRRMERWQAFIKRDGKSRCLGTFPTFDGAAAARKAAEVEQGYHPNHGKVRSTANCFIPRRDRVALQTQLRSETRP